LQMTVVLVAKFRMKMKPWKVSKKEKNSSRKASKNS
jgi:hypothetical protein